MSVFVDTSAFLALLEPEDENHSMASQIWERLLRDGVKLICSNYVLIETFALLQRRFGMAAVKDFQESVVPVLAVVWVDQSIHDASVAAMLVANQRRLSLVNC